MQTTVSVGLPRPSVSLGAALEEQIRYPYGCVEQTSGRLLSLLYASQIVDPTRTKAIEEMVKAGIARLWSMQTYSGSPELPGPATRPPESLGNRLCSLVPARSPKRGLQDRFAVHGRTGEVSRQSSEGHGRREDGTGHPSPDLSRARDVRRPASRVDG